MKIRITNKQKHETLIYRVYIIMTLCYVWLEVIFTSSLPLGSLHNQLVIWNEEFFEIYINNAVW